MNIIKDIQNRRDELERLSRRIQNALKRSPSGNLRISRSKGGVYFYKLSEDRNEKDQYISKKNEELIRQLAQKDYLQEVLKRAEEEAAFLGKVESGIPDRRRRRCMILWTRPAGRWSGLSSKAMKNTFCGGWRFRMKRNPSVTGTACSIRRTAKSSGRNPKSLSPIHTRRKGFPIDMNSRYCCGMGEKSIRISLH